MSLPQKMTPLRRTGALLTPSFTTTTRLFSIQAARQADMPKIRHPPKTRYSSGGAHQTMSKMGAKATKEAGNTNLFPTTFISLPLSQYPSSWRDALSYQWERTKITVSDYGSIINLKMTSWHSWRSRPLFQAQRKKIVPTAKVLHREMLEAFAAGDRETLSRICIPKFANQLISAIDRRKANEGTAFELKKYTRGFFYPRLKSHMAHQWNPLDADSINDQAVVAISSTQRMAKYNKQTGVEELETVKERDQIEYIVLSRMVDRKTWQKTDWQIFGTTTATSLQAWQDMNDKVSALMSDRAGWTNKGK